MSQRAGAGNNLSENRSLSVSKGGFRIDRKVQYGDSPDRDGGLGEAGEAGWWLALAVRSLAPVVLFALLLFGIVARLMATPEARAAGPLAGIPVLVLVLCAASLCPRRT